MNNDKYLTVTQLTRYIKFRLDNDPNLVNVFLKGEISNFKRHTSGILYFTIKDENSRINAVMFQNGTKKLNFVPQDGMKVMVIGKISVYEATGGYQIYVNEMIEDGLGNLYIKFEELKKKLSLEGLFDESHKRPIPKFPKRIGVITAPTGAAIRDIMITIKRRWPLVEVLLFPSLVQGASASSDIVRQINNAQNYSLDTLIVGRGGGSIEDLWCFNDEEVARAIYNSSVPVISGVGHEIDFTISDFVADLRAATPTAAAEVAVPNKMDVFDYINQTRLRLNKSITSKLELYNNQLSNIRSSYIFKDPTNIYLVKLEKFDHVLEKLKLNVNNLVLVNREKLNRIKTNYVIKNMDEYFKSNYINPYINLLNKLEVLNPLLTIKRGYSITKKDNKVITSVKDLKINDNINIDLEDGSVSATIGGINNER